MTPDASLQPNVPWYRELTRYHWWILLICSLGWLFDTMDQRVFVLARNKAMTELVGKQVTKWDSDRMRREFAKEQVSFDIAGPTDPQVKAFVDKRAFNRGVWSTTIFMIGWATGGIIFGIMGDKWGRARTMLLTILVYALFTALSGFSQNPGQFMFFRFLTGLGVGGEFSAGVSLLAEVIPERPRPYALGLLQGLSAIGNILGSIIGYFVLPIDWRYLFFIGAVPALLVVAVRGRLKEPETWKDAKAKADSGEGRELGSYRDLFAIRKWRRNALIGVALAVIGVTGVWGVGFNSPELVKNALTGHSPADVDRAKSLMTLFQDVGAFFSMFGFALISSRIGRKPTFFLACISGIVTIAFVFGTLGTFSNNSLQVIPYGFVLGLGLMIMFGGYAVYFPEIFPTRLRSTGVSFCYNVGRYLAALLNLVQNQIRGPMERAFPRVQWFRSTAMAMSSLYLVGMVIVWFAPETLNKPLPTDDDEDAQPA